MKNQNLPPHYLTLQTLCEQQGFTMPSDLAVGQLLKALCYSKPGGRFLELGTGAGLSLSWMIAGMREGAKTISLDNDAGLTGMVKAVITNDNVDILVADSDEWITDYSGPGFDLIFADTWPGKYRLLEETLALLHPGGFYVVDDMTPQEHWPEEHYPKAAALREHLLQHPALLSVELPFGSGMILGTKV